METIKTNLVRIGNSRGIRIPKVLLEQAGFGREVEIFVKGKKLIVQSARVARKGWAEKLKQMHERGDDRLIDPYVPTKFDKEEWEW